MAPVRVQLSRKRGWRMPENTVKVDRSTPWGNPFARDKGGVKTNHEAHTLFAHMINGYYALACGPEMADMQRYRIFANDHIGELRGKNLACWCKRGSPCHADVLLELANSPTTKDTRDG